MPKNGNASRNDVTDDRPASGVNTMVRRLGTVGVTWPTETNVRFVAIVTDVVELVVEVDVPPPPPPPC